MKARINDGASCASRIARILDTIGERDGVIGAYCECSPSALTGQIELIA